MEETNDAFEDIYYYTSARKGDRIEKLDYLLGVNMPCDYAWKKRLYNKDILTENSLYFVSDISIVESSDEIFNEFDYRLPQRGDCFVSKAIADFYKIRVNSELKIEGSKFKVSKICQETQAIEINSKDYFGDDSRALLGELIIKSENIKSIDDFQGMNERILEENTYKLSYLKQLSLFILILLGLSLANIYFVNKGKLDNMKKLYAIYILEGGKTKDLTLILSLENLIISMLSMGLSIISLLLIKKKLESLLYTSIKPIHLYISILIVGPISLIMALMALSAIKKKSLLEMMA